MFSDWGEVTGYDLILTDDEHKVVRFNVYSSDGKMNCGVNKCVKVIKVGQFNSTEKGASEGQSSQLPLIIKPTEDEIIKKLSLDNVKVIGTEISSTSVRHLFCSICGYDFNLTSFKMAKNGCVICVNCQKNYHNIVKDISNGYLKSQNFVYLDQNIGWFNHKSYENRTKMWFR